MGVIRPIREEEITLIKHLLAMKGLDFAQFKAPGQVDEYENGKMGSIGMGLPTAEYLGDIIRVQFADADKVPVVVSLTQDTNHELLDLDFFKADFSKLITYPTPSMVSEYRGL
jgi:hypothetical protein